MQLMCRGARAHVKCMQYHCCHDLMHGVDALFQPGAVAGCCPARQGSFCVTCSASIWQSRALVACPLDAHVWQAVLLPLRAQQLCCCCWRVVLFGGRAW
jgi:hypothetical protein